MWKPEKKKNHGEQEGEFHYNSEKITIVIAWSYALGFLGLIHCPPSCWSGSTIYKGGCLLDKVTESCSI